MKNSVTGLDVLRRDIRSNNLRGLYIFFGAEKYLKRYYFNQIKSTILSEDTIDFNFSSFNAGNINANDLNNALESLPFMSDTKIVVLYDVDILKPPSDLQGILHDLIDNMPDYLCLIIYYDEKEYKVDKREAIYKKVQNIASIVEFSPLSPTDMIKWINKRVKHLNKNISIDTSNYLTFKCGNLMENLIGEINKLCNYVDGDELLQEHIDEVCVSSVDAIIFDLTDFIINKDFYSAIKNLKMLLKQNNDPIMISSYICKHISRIYSVKLASNSNIDRSVILGLVGTQSSYYLNKLVQSCYNVSIEQIRCWILILSELDYKLKSESVDKESMIEISILKMAGIDG